MLAISPSRGDFAVPAEKQDPITTPVALIFRDFMLQSLNIFFMFAPETVFPSPCPAM